MKTLLLMAAAAFLSGPLWVLTSPFANSCETYLKWDAALQTHKPACRGDCPPATGPCRLVFVDTWAASCTCATPVPSNELCHFQMWYDENTQSWIWPPDCLEAVCEPGAAPVECVLNLPPPPWDYQPCVCP